MISPSPRQQAGYLRRLLRRGEIQIVDSSTGRPVQALVELHGETVRLTPVSPRPTNGHCLDETQQRWAALIERMSAMLCIEDAEELVGAVEAEHRKSELLESFGN